MYFKAISLISIVSFSISCSQLEKVGSLDSLSNNVPVGVSVNKPGIGDVDLTQAVGAAVDIGKAVTISDEEIQKMAMSYSKHSDSKRRLAPPASKYAKRLGKLTSKHTSTDGLKLNFKAYIDPQINAFALANGSIRVYSGLMDMMTDDELLFIIGHEIGHVKHGHSAGRIKLANAASGIRKGVGSTSNLAGALADEELLGGMVEKVINSQYSQSNETEADEYGISFMKKNGYNVEAAITSFNKLAAMDGKSSFIDGLFASHPTSDDRAQHLSELIGSESNIKIVSSGPAKSPEKVDSADTKQVTNSASDTTSAQADSFNNQKSEQNLANTHSQKGTDSGWYVQVTASLSKPTAAKLREDLKRNGFNAGEQSAVVRGQTFHRVIVGPYQSKLQAAQASVEITKTGSIDDSPFLRYLN